MKNGFLKVAAALPSIRVGDVEGNLSECIRTARELAEDGADVVAFPELSITSASCADMFFNRALLFAAEGAVAEFMEKTKEYGTLFVIGAPVKVGDGVYSAAIAVRGGEVLAIAPLSGLGSGVSEFSAPGDSFFAGHKTVVCREPIISVGDEKRSVTLTVLPPAKTLVCKSGAEVVIIPAAEPEGIGAAEKRRERVSEADITAALYTAPSPELDMIVRTGGDLRISNFLLWQAAYAELYFTDVLWPDFDEKELNKAILEFLTYGKGLFKKPNISILFSK